MPTPSSDKVKELVASWYIKHYHLLLTYASARFHNKENAKDALQETFEKILEKPPDYLMNIEYPNLFLRRILYTTFIDFYRQQKKNRICPLKEASPKHVRIENEIFEKKEAIDPIVVLKIAEEVLRENELNALFLYYFEGKKQREISLLMGQPENTIASWLKRGKEKIKKAYLEGGSNKAFKI